MPQKTYPLRGSTHLSPDSQDETLQIVSDREGGDIITFNAIETYIHLDLLQRHEPELRAAADKAVAGTGKTIVQVLAERKGAMERPCTLVPHAVQD